MLCITELQCQRIEPYLKGNLCIRSSYTELKLIQFSPAFEFGADIFH